MPDSEATKERGILGHTDAAEYLDALIVWISQNEAHLDAIPDFRQDDSPVDGVVVCDHP